MRKIPKELENPVDNILIDGCEKVAPIFYNAGFTPNMITTLSNISAIIVILLLLNAKYMWAAFMFMVAYFFDCLDGYVARTYNMTSKFGDYYDHISDILKFISIVGVLIYIDKDKFIRILPILLLFGILTLPQLGCQELYYKGDESKSLSITKSFCPISTINEACKNNNMGINSEDILKSLEYTRYFGTGTFSLIFSLSFLYYDI